MMPRGTEIRTWLPRLDDTPVDGQIRKGITSNWAYHHNSQRVRKTDDETVHNSATLQDDDVLHFAIGAYESWAFEFIILYISQPAADIKFAITVPSGAALWWTINGQLKLDESESVVPSTVIFTSGQASPTAGLGTQQCVRLIGFVKNGATAGNVQLQWAQNTAHDSDTTVKGANYNSNLIAHKLD